MKNKPEGLEKLESGQWVDYYGHCPEHNTKRRKEYGFGKNAKAPCPDAFVTVYKGCECATQTNGGSLRTLYFDNYPDAASEARYTIQRLSAAYGERF